MRGVIRDLAFGLRSLTEEPRGVALVAIASILAGTLSLAIWTQIDEALLGGVEPIEVGGLYAVTTPQGTPARAVFWSEPASSLTGACVRHALAAASHLHDRCSWLEQLDWNPPATPEAPSAEAGREESPEPELSPCQLEA